MVPLEILSLTPWPRRYPRGFSTVCLFDMTTESTFQIWSSSTNQQRSKFSLHSLKMSLPLGRGGAAVTSKSRLSNESFIDAKGNNERKRKFWLLFKKILEGGEKNIVKNVSTRRIGWWERYIVTYITILRLPHNFLWA